MKSYYVYILTNILKTVLYIGVTNDINRRIDEHKKGAIKGFTEKYKCCYLVYVEETNDIQAALQREKQLKKWNREWKEKLISKQNPEWNDLSEHLF